MAQRWHPTVEMVTPELVAGLARAEGIDVEEALKRLLTQRELTLSRMDEEPALYGFVPPIWKVCWALLGVPWVDGDWARRMRERLEFDRPVRSLLILGGQRSSKTQFEVTSLMRRMIQEKIGAQGKDVVVWMFHMTHQQSVDWHQGLMHGMIPRGWRRKVKTEREYISFTEQRGFTDDKFILANGARCSFRYYQQDIRDAIEGAEVDAAAADELIPAEWVETLEFRMATRNGWLLVGFTPVDGYSATVKMFCDGAKVVKDSPAYLLPKDGGPPDEAAALGLTAEEYAEVRQALVEERMPNGPPCRPEICGEWIEERKTEKDGLPDGGRMFERVPRVLQCKGRNAAVVFFHSRDNPFGNAANVIEKSRSLRRDEKLIRFYGVAEKSVGARFARFDERVHVVPAAAIPDQGTNYQAVDPCSGRAFFMLWARATHDGKLFVYREWPGKYEIPGMGVPDDWAEPSGGKEHDGKKGRGQKSPGWGLAGYKREIGRLEKWMAQEIKAESGKQNKEMGELWRMERPAGMTEEQWVGTWNERGPARERVEARFIDSRFANVRSFEDGGMVTLIEKFDEIGLTFLDSATGGGKWTIEDGCELIESALAWDQNQPLSFFNQPKLYVSAECRNLIFALLTWTGEDGQSGATKDPIDCLRMLYLKGVSFRDERRRMVAGRGCY